MSWVLTLSTALKLLTKMTLGAHEVERSAEGIIMRALRKFNSNVPVVDSDCEVGDDDDKEGA